MAQREERKEAEEVTGRGVQSHCMAGLRACSWHEGFTRCCVLLGDRPTGERRRSRLENGWETGIRAITSAAFSHDHDREIALAFRCRVLGTGTWYLVSGFGFWYLVDLILRASVSSTMTMTTTTSHARQHNNNP